MLLRNYFTNSRWLSILPYIIYVKFKAFFLFLGKIRITMVIQYQILFIVALAAALVMFLLAGYVARFRKIAYARYFIGLLVAIGLWTGAIAIGLLAKTEAESFMWSVIRMTPVFFVPVLWFFFSLQFSQNKLGDHFILFLVFSIIPAVSFILMATNSYHNLFLKGIQYVQHGNFLVDETWVFATWFFVHLIYSYGLILMADAILLRKAFQQAHLYRKQAILLIAGTLLPLLINISYTLRLIPAIKVNYDPLSFVLAGLIFTFAIFRFKLFDISPIAKNLLLENMEDIMLVVDAQLRLVDFNPAAWKLIKGERTGLIGNKLADLLENFDFEQGVNTRLEYFPKLLLTHCFEAQISPIYSRNILLGHIILMRDISERKQLEERLNQLAMTDPLTGLFNRRHFLYLAEKEINRSRRYGHSYSVCFMDLDGFKRVNDRYGHLRGDEVLIAVTKIISSSFRKTDILSRYGGDEFVVMMVEISPQDAEMTAQRIQSKFKNLSLENQIYDTPLTVSIGMLHFTGHATLTVEELVHQADQLMYRAKELGENVLITDGNPRLVQPEFEIS